MLCLSPCRYRMGEVGTAFDLLNALNKRQGVPGLALSGGLGDPVAFFGGRLDMRAVALAGHSYGGGTVGALTAGDPRFRAGIALDPWWCASAAAADSPGRVYNAAGAPCRCCCFAWNGVQCHRCRVCMMQRCSLRVHLLSVLVHY